MKSYTKIKNQLLKDKVIREVYRDMGDEFMLAKGKIAKALDINKIV